MVAQIRPKPNEGHEAEESPGLNTRSGLSLEGFAKRRSDRSLTNELVCPSVCDREEIGQLLRRIAVRPTVNHPEARRF